MAGIYIHIPFCKTKCGYCDFYSITDCSKMGRTISAIKRELSEERNFFAEESNTKIKTIYFGGGTPSLCTVEQLQSIIDHIATLWNIDGVVEITVEANPDDLSNEYLTALQRSSVNRLSIGVQSFVDVDLRFMNRRHSAAQAYQAVERAKKAGFDNITIDLIFGIPNMTIDQWENNIKKAIELDVGHISAYHLTFEQGTPMGNLYEQGKLMHVSDTQSQEQYMLLNRLLTQAGYDHYETSSFAKSGMRAIHNGGYWHAAHYLGVGPGAHSYNGEQRRWVVGSVERYTEAVESRKRGEVYELERLTDQDKHNEFVMLSLRMSQGLRVSEIEKRFGRERAERFVKIASRYVAEGVLSNQGERYWIEPVNFLSADQIVSALFI